MPIIYNKETNNNSISDFKYSLNKGSENNLPAKLDNSSGKSLNKAETCKIELTNSDLEESDKEEITIKNKKVDPDVQIASTGH